MRDPLLAAPLLALALCACQDVSNPEPEANESEVITTVVLTFAPQGGGPALEYRWADPESDGNPEIDDLVLSDAEDYALSVRLLDELEDPPEDITLEVDREGDVHQLFFFGSAVEGPATGPNPGAIVTHAYADQDDGGLPVGLENALVTEATGTGTLSVLLRHLPLENDSPVKVADLAERAAEEGFDALPGDTDVAVGFTLTVE